MDSLGFRRSGTCTSHTLIASAIVVLFSVTLAAQTSTGRILGMITDTSGASVPEASVTITDSQRGTSRKLTTDTSGSYNAPSLTPSTYTIRAEKQGFKVIERPGVVLDVNGQVQIDLTLQPGEQVQTVTISAEAALIETTNATLGGTLENKVINDLPLNGRNFTNLLDLRPGTVKAPGGSNFNQSTDGSRPHSEMYLVEGAYSNDPWNAKSLMNANMSAGDAGTMLPIEAIDQFKTQQNPQAEYGWKNGSVTTVGIKSGTNAYHGSAFAYGRNGAWDAQNFFLSGKPLPGLSVEQYGASLGAPILKDKLFYFVDYESQLYDLDVPTTGAAAIASSDPSIIAKYGTSTLIGACQAALAGSGVAPVSAQLAGLSTNCTPLSNFPGLFPNNNGANGTSWATTLASSNSIYSGVGKVDYHLNEKNTIAGSFFRSKGSGAFAAPGEAFLYKRLDQDADAQFVNALWTWVPNSQWVNVVHFGLSRYRQSFIAADATQDPANYNPPGVAGGPYHLYTGQTNPDAFGFPAVTIGGFDLSLTGAGFPQIVGPNYVYYISDNISYQWGRHSIMLGGQIVRNDATVWAPGTAKGAISFSNLTNFFVGTVNSANINQGEYHREYVSNGYAGFLQDEWHVRPGLTVNLGLRYEYFGAPTEAHNLIANFIPGTAGLVQAGSSQLGSVYNPSKTNFAPRIGIAWSLDRKTVLRVGGGIAYDNGSLDALNSFANRFGLGQDPTGVPLYLGGSSNPVTAGGTISAASFSYSGASAAPISASWKGNGPNTPLFPSFVACGDGATKTSTGVTPGQCSVVGIDRNIGTPMVTTWTVDLQRSLGNSLTLDVAYVGNHGDLWGVKDINQPAPGTGWTASILAACEANPIPGNCAPSAATETAARPYSAAFPYLKYIDVISKWETSNYNGLQAALTQRVWHGLSYVAGYTWSHALGDSADSWRFMTPTNSSAPQNQYGNSVFDIRHRFTYSVTYALPGRRSAGQALEGWSVNSIVHLQSGMPWHPGDLTTDFSGTGETGNGNASGERWNFFGNYSDFNWTKSLINQNGISYAKGTSNANCLAKAQAVGPAAVASLANLGCYYASDSVMIPAAYGSYGNMGVNNFFGPGFTNLDFSVSKTWNFKEHVRAQFRAEFFNVLNHPSFANPNGGPSFNTSGTTNPSASAGSNFGINRATPDVASSNPVLGSGGPRAIQLGLKILF